MSLPKGWIKVKFTDVLDVQGGTQPPKSQFIDTPKDGYIRLLQIRDFGKKPVPTYIPDTTKLKKVTKNDVLIGRYGASVGRICTGMEGAYNVALAKVLKTSDISSEYLRYYLLSTLFQIPLSLISRSAQNGFNKQDLAEIDFLLPPLDEQKRIAQKLDEVLSTVESIKTRLDNAPSILKRFRQSILAAATSGKLTEEWRRENGIAEEWDALTVDDVATVGTGNTPLKSNTSFYENGDIPWLTSSVTGSPFVYEADKFVTQQAIDECRLKLYESGTLLVAMYGEGKTRGQVTELTFPASINQACAAIVVDEDKIEKSYLKMRLQENYAVIRLLAEGGNQPNLNLSKVRSITVPTPSTDEQKEIVSQVESLFALADSMEAKIEAAQKHVDKLTQSILAKAFRGELVPQDPNDEPAEKLLERIRVEQESVKGKKRSRKKKNINDVVCKTSNDLKEFIAKNYKESFFTTDELIAKKLCSFDDLINYLFELMEEELISLKVENNQKLYKLNTIG